MQYCAKVSGGKCCKARKLSNRKTSDWLQIHSFCCRTMNPNIQPMPLRTTCSVKKNKESWRRLYGSHRALISPMCQGLHEETEDLWLVLKGVWKTFLSSSFKSCEQVYLKEPRPFEGNNKDLLDSDFSSTHKHIQSYFKAFMDICLKHLQSSLRQY